MGETILSAETGRDDRWDVELEEGEELELEVWLEQGVWVLVGVQRTDDGKSVIQAEVEGEGEGETVESFEVPTSGEYRVTILARGDMPNPAIGKFELREAA